MRPSLVIVPLLSCLVLAYGWAAASVVSTAHAPAPELEAQATLVVLGKRLTSSGVLDDDFLARIHRLDDLLSQSATRTAIATGASFGASVSEARMVSQLLPHHAIVLEERATSTRENLRFSRELANPSQPLGVITSRYHLARTQLLARQKGLKVQLVPAEERWEWTPANLAAVSREALLYWPAHWGW